MSTCLDFDKGMWDHHPLPMVMIASHGVLNVVINFHIYLDLISFDITLKFTNRLDAHV